MSRNALLMDKAQVKVIIGPVDLNDGANTGARVDMSKCERVSFICAAGVGTAPSSHTFTFEQHSVASAGSPLALSIGNPYFHCLNSAAAFTKVTPGANASSYDLDTLVGDNEYVVIFEVLADQLADGYQWVSINQSDSGGAQLGSVIAVLHDGVAKPAYGVEV